jgi:hypothetical protein
MFITPVVKDFDQQFQDGSFAFSLSYVDDIALVVCSPNGPRIVLILSRKAIYMIEQAEQLGFSFSVAKTEFILLNNEEQDIELSITIQQHTFPNQSLLRYLGFWIASDGTWSAHWEKRKNIAQQRMNKAKSLIAIQTYRGLAPSITINLSKPSSSPQSYTEAMQKDLHRHKP